MLLGSELLSKSIHGSQGLASFFTFDLQRQRHANHENDVSHKRSEPRLRRFK